MNRPKGTKDIFGNRQRIRTSVKETLSAVARIYNFEEIETPIFERKEVFVKSVGETSDIVSKEMYEFKDKKGREMVLRPEGTAGTIRAIVENKLFVSEDTSKVFYMGPMFRYENPQKGRQRQFTQFGVEMICDKDPYADAEVILMADLMLKALGLKSKLLINSLGDKETREAYSTELKKYFKKNISELSEDSVNRIDKNPMRILDDKVDAKKDVVINAPKISEFYSKETKEYLDTLTNFLKSMEVEFEIDQSLVRGLDYYTDTAFEFVSVSDVAGSQSTLIGGGRYSGLVKSFGGPDKSGIGFGIGIERIVNDVEALLGDEIIERKVQAYVLNIDESSMQATAGIVNMLRTAGLVVDWNRKPTKLVKAFDKADKAGAFYKIIAGKKELEKGNVMVKFNDVQEEVAITELIAYISKNIGGNDEEN